MLNFDADFSRVTCQHYITGKAAINFHWPGTTTGGWHNTAYWNKDTGRVKVSLAGVHFPDTSALLGDVGILDAAAELGRRGWVVDREIWIADHYRAAVDLAIAWSIGKAPRCNIELSDWFPENEDHKRVVELLTSVLNKIDMLSSNRLASWLQLQCKVYTDNRPSS